MNRLNGLDLLNNTSILENLSDVLWIADAEFHFQYVSSSSEKIFGGSFIQKQLEQQFSPESIVKIQDILSAQRLNMNTDETSHEIQVQQFHADGSLLWISMQMFFVRSTNGEIEYIYGISKDITDQKRATEALAEKEKYRYYFEHVPEPFFVFNQTGSLIDANKATIGDSGFSKEELLHMSVFDLVTDDSHSKVNKMFHTLQKKGSARGTIKARRIDGAERWMVFTVVKIKENTIMGFAFDITDRMKILEKLKYLSYYDYLTGLYNRRYFDEKKKKLKKLPISIIIGDINGLKIINDAFGYEEGDKMIRQAASIIKSSCRKQDIVARTGGDEFSILLPKTKLETAIEIMNKIKESFQAYNATISNELFQINISLGANTKDQNEQDFSKITKTAEDYMRYRKLMEHKSSHSSIITSLTVTMHEKSNETEEHEARLVELSQMMGRELRLSQIEMDNLTLFASLHDVGKIAISDKLLNKTTKLTDEEFTEIKKHPEIGYRIAMSTHDLSPIGDYILTHHERWDGTGYPRNLAGTDIPLLSRLLAIVDAYDAMTHDRPYRKALSCNEALEEIERNAGTQFDPELAEIFVKKIHDRNTSCL